MRAAIDDLAASVRGNPRSRSVAVLGDMLELGPEGPALHRQIGEHARAAGVDLLVTVGALATEIGAGFGEAGPALPDAEAAAATVPGLLEPGDTVLVKGSRGVGLERLSDALRTGALPGSAAGPVRGGGR
jgi:UDP-N-acetylmuramyl pentapeptide synthase